MNINERQAEVAPAAIRHARWSTFVKSKQDTPVYLMHNTGEGAPGLMPPHLIPKDVIKHSLPQSAFISLPGRRRRWRQRRRHSFRGRKRWKQSRFHSVSPGYFPTVGSGGSRYPGTGSPKGQELAACLSVTELLAE